MKLDKTKKTVKLSGLVCLVAAIYFLGGPGLSAQQTQLQLVPPMNGASDDYFILSDDDAHVPNSITFRKPSRNVKQLPEATSRTQDYRGRALPVGYDLPSGPMEGSVIPQYFLNEESTPASAEPEKLPTKKPTPPPKPMADPSTQGGGVSEIPLGDCNEFYGGVYGECSPMVMNNCFTTCPIVQPFGCGLLDNLTFFGGMTAFRTEIDGPQKGNFGITEGLNWAGPATPQNTISAQVGFRAVQSNLFGNTEYSDGSFTKKCREQYFVTAGFFKRDLCYPVQGGVVFDWFHDAAYGKIESEQIRAELSLRTFSNLEYGFQGGFGVSKKDWNVNRDGEPAVLRYRPENYYLGFGRKHFENGGLAEIRAGATENGDFVMGGSGEFPINDRVSLNGSFSVLCPKEGNKIGGYGRECWEVSVGMVFYFRGGACSKPCNPCRPMFDVAGNGSFFNRFSWR